MELPTDIIFVIRGFLPNSLNVRLVSKAFGATGSNAECMTYLNTPGIDLDWALTEFLRSSKGKLTYLEARGFLTMAADQQDLSFARTIVPHVATHSDFVWAASHGHVKVLQLLHDLGIHWKDWKHVMDFTAQRGQIESIRWLCQHGATWSKDATKWAAFYGHLEVLQWLISNGCPYRIKDIIAETRSLLWKVGAECRVWAFRFQGSDGDLFGVTPTDYTRAIEKAVKESPTLEEAVHVFADTRSRFWQFQLR